MIQALNKNSIRIKNENDRIELLKNLKNSYNKISSSPKLKLGSNNTNEENLIHKHDYLYNDIKLKPMNIDNLSFKEKGKKHFDYHPSLESNINFEFRDKYDNPKQRIDQLVDYYKEAGEKEQKYHFNPEIYSFYNKEQSDLLQKFSEKVRSVNLSKENPNYVIGNLNTYFRKTT